MATTGLQYAPGSQSPNNGSSASLPSHKRVYQACIPCRRRKVRCDLGSVDEPHDPPCQRCRRESKDCFFSATRRKRGSGDGADLDLDDDVEDDYSVRNGRKRLRMSTTHDGASPPTTNLPSYTSPGSHPPAAHLVSGTQQSPTGLQQPLTPGGSWGRARPLARPDAAVKSPLSPYYPSVDAARPPQPSARAAAATADSGDDDQRLTNRLWEAEVYNGHDALNLLFEAAGRSGDMGNADVGPKSDPTRPSHAAVDGPARVKVSSRSQTHQRIGSASHIKEMGPPRPKQRPPVVPTDSSAHSSGTPSRQFSGSRVDSPELGDALKAWSRLRFVRAGWFTAREAIDYIDYFYTYLGPLTPVLPPMYHAPTTHSVLLSDEPILTVTLLTISSRYMELSGPGGRSRSYAIHEKLWTYLRGMIERMVWGQEQFNGGFGKEGEGQTSSTAPWRGLKKGSLRTLGTVESLLLLTEWHPRALHFPPGDDGDELVVKDDLSLQQDGSDNGQGVRDQRGIGGRRIESWLEPAWRSDRMCWMLLGNALALAYELGVFDDGTVTKAFGVEPPRPDRELQSYRVRANRVQKLLYVYVTQLAGRLEWTSMIQDAPLIDREDHGIDVSVAKMQAAASHLDEGGMDDALVDDAILDCWIKITNLMKTGNELIFPTRKVTRDLIRSGRYVSLLESFAPKLRSWLEDFERIQMPDFIRFVLRIEFEYVRVYINSLALQAVVERCTNNAGNSDLALPPNPRDRAGTVAFSTLMGPKDQEYTRDVVDASRDLLRTVVEGLLPGDYLKHCPVRTYFRIISGAMFLLKTFALGAKEEDVAISLGLMDSTVEALRNCIVDDVHLGIRFAELLEVLTKRIRSRFVRMAATHGGRGSNSMQATFINPGTGTNAQQQQQQQHQQLQPRPDALKQQQQQQQQQQAWNQTAEYAQSTAMANDDPLIRSSSNPLFGISTTTISPADTQGRSVSIMPPPLPHFAASSSSTSRPTSPGAFNLGSGSGSGSGADDPSSSTLASYYPADWLGLDLNPLLNYGSSNSGGGGANLNYDNNGTGSGNGSGSHSNDETNDFNDPTNPQNSSSHEDTANDPSGGDYHSNNNATSITHNNNNNNNANFTQTYAGAAGVSVGGFDLLEVLLNDVSAEDGLEGQVMGVGMGVGGNVNVGMGVGGGMGMGVGVGMGSDGGMVGAGAGGAGGAGGSGMGGGRGRGGHASTAGAGLF